MPVQTLYQLSQVVLPGGTIHQITDQNLDPGIQEVLLGGSGSIDNEMAGGIEVKPQLSFTTTALATALTVAGAGGYAYNSGTAAFYFRPIGVGSTRGDTACIKLASGAGLVIPKSIKASDDGKEAASIDYDVYFLSPDGITAPITTSTGVTLPTQPIASEAFSSGPIKINGAFIPSVSSLEFDFGLKCETIRSDGYAYPTWAGIAGQRNPKLTPKLYDMSLLDSLGTAGAALNNGLAVSAWIAWFRQIKTGSTRWPDVATKHLKIIGTTGYLRHDKHSGSSSKAMMGDYSIFPLSDGTNSIVTVSPGVAIA